MTLESRRERAEQGVADFRAAFIVDHLTAAQRYTRALATIRTLWVSRRKWRAIAEWQAVELSNVRALHSGAEHYISELEELHRPTGVLALRTRVAELETWKDRVVGQARRAVEDLDRWHRLYEPTANDPTPTLADLIDRALNARDAARARVAELEEDNAHLLNAQHDGGA